MQPENLYQNLLRNFEHIPTLDQRVALKMLSSFVFSKDIKRFCRNRKNNNNADSY